MKDATRSSKKRCRDTTSKAPRKKQKQNTPLSHTFLVEDTPYCPRSTSPRSTRKVTPNRKEIAKRVPRIPEKSRRDPFHVLNDDEIYQIIGRLPIRETETLRRVSRLWKATSEYHCGNHALLKHFPWAASRGEESMSREEANLQFRRHCMYSSNPSI